MNDFLASLAQRSFEPAASAIRPRTPSRFESTLPSAAANAIDPAESAEPTESLLGRRESAALTDTGRSPRALEVPWSPPAVTGRFDEFDASLRRLGSETEPSEFAHPASAERRPTAPIVDEPRQRPAMVVSPAVGPSVVPPVQIPAVQRSETAVFSRDEAAPRQSEKPASSESRRVESAADAIRIVEHRAVVRPANPATTGGLAPAAPRIAAEPLQAPRRSHTVNVTIGRIEVRATNAPSTTPVARAKPAAPPVMTLAEYLRHRAGGER